MIMNSYSENLQVAVDDTLSALLAQQSKLDSDQTSAQYSLYYAQGAQITAQEKLSEAVKAYDFAKLVNDQGIDNNNQAINLLATGTEAENNVKAAVTNVSTAANDVQVAANAVLRLSADVGAALSIVSAADLGTDIHRKTRDANEYMKTVALQAEYTSQIAMDASTSTAEIISSVVKTETTTAVAEVESLLKTTEGEFAALVKTRDAANVRVGNASMAERKLEGILKDADKEAFAINKAFGLSNEELNFNIVTKATTIYDFSLSFDAYVQPYKANNQNTNGAIIPEAVDEYYVTVVKASKKKLFNLGQAELNFAEFRHQCYKLVTPTESLNPHNIDTKGLLDSDQDTIVAGKAYVAFIYVKINYDYKRLVDNYNDIISAPVESFTLASPLGVPSDILQTASVTDNKRSTLSFTIEQSIKAGTEYRVIFLPENLPGMDVFMVNSSLDKAAVLANETSKNHHLGFYFNQSIAEQVSSGNYTKATLITTETPQVEKLNSPMPPSHYQVTVQADTTDNFGNEIIPEQSYFVVVLAVMEASSQQNYGKYTNQMTNPVDYCFKLVSNTALVNSTTKDGKH